MKTLFFILVALASLNYSYAISCKKQWGEGKILMTKGDDPYCQLSSPDNGEPSSFRVENFRWKYHEQSLLLDLLLKDDANLGGIRFSFWHRGKIAAFYEYLHYSDLEYNLLQADLPASFSLAASDLNWQNGKTSEKVKEFDGMTIYLVSKKGHSVDLFIKGKKLLAKPKKGAISITFDDGYESNFLAAKAMSYAGLRGTAYIIEDALNTDGYLNDRHLELMKKWGWSLSTHHTLPVTQMDKPEKTLHTDRDKIATRSSKYEAAHLALPLGKYNKKLLGIVTDLFASVRLAGGGHETLPPGRCSSLKNH